MSHPTYEKYRSLVVPLNDDAEINRLLQVLVDTPRNRLADFHGASAHGGQFYILKDGVAPGKVLEYVPDLAQDTSVSTLYSDTALFNNRQHLIEAREEIIREIEILLLAVPGTPTILDEGRGKEFHLFELGTAQLLDVLHHFSTN